MNIEDLSSWIAEILPWTDQVTSRLGELLTMIGNSETYAR